MTRSIAIRLTSRSRSNKADWLSQQMARLPGSRFLANRPNPRWTSAPEENRPKITSTFGQRPRRRLLGVRNRPALRCFTELGIVRQTDWAGIGAPRHPFSEPRQEFGYVGIDS